MDKINIRKIIVFFIGIASCLTIYGQLTATGTHIKLDKPGGLDYVFIFNAIDNATEIKYTGTAPAPFRWNKLANGVQTLSVQGADYISPENNTGYVLLDADGKQIASFWVFDYRLYTPVLKSLRVLDGESPCTDVELKLEADILPFQYQNLLGGKLTLPRKFKISYKSLDWKENSWVDKNEEFFLTLPTVSDILAPAPFTDTSFTLSGDEFATQLGVPVSPAVSSIYTTKAVKGKITTITSRVRADVLNENNRPETATQLIGSAPLDINFFSNPTPAANTYTWRIFKDKSSVPFLIRAVRDNNYSFTEAGKYLVELTVSNQYCSHKSTVNVEVSESMLAVPKVFTPNGDGVQDEFRVAYQSIIEFDAVVFNRWGRKLFSWNDTAKGWDGTVNGRAVPEGPYYYTITAKGSDDKVYKLKGHINLLR